MSASVDRDIIVAGIRELAAQTTVSDVELSTAGIEFCVALYEALVMAAAPVVAKGEGATEAMEALVGTELAYQVLSEIAKASSKLGDGNTSLEEANEKTMLTMPVPAVARTATTLVPESLPPPDDGTRPWVMVAAFVDYMLAEALELGYKAAINARSEAIRKQDIVRGLSADAELSHFFGSRVEGVELGVAIGVLPNSDPAGTPSADAPVALVAAAEPSCGCKRWIDSEDGGDRVGTGPCCYFRWQTVGREAMGMDSWPFERWSCGFWAPGTDHSAHDATRCAMLQKTAIIISTLAMETCKYESSEIDCEYSAFALLVEDGALEGREPPAVARYLAERLELNPAFASAKALPIDEEHRDFMLTAYPGLEADDLEAEARLSKEFRTLLSDCFFFKGQTGTGLINTYPVVFAGFLPSGDIAGVYAIRVDT